MIKLKIKTKPRKIRCGKCKKNSGLIKFYLFPGDEKMRAYHPPCKRALKINTSQKTSKEIRLGVAKKIFEAIRFKGNVMRFSYYNKNRRRVYAEVTLNIKWNK